jgi:hypothetical protein
METNLFFKHVPKEQIIALVEKATNEMFNVETNENKPTERAQKLLDLIVGKFGCQEKEVIDLVDEITGEDLKSFYKQKTENNYVELACFKVISENDDGWPIGDMAIITNIDDPDCIYLEDSEIGNTNMPNQNCMSKPSHKEIVDFITEIIKKS